MINTPFNYTGSKFKLLQQIIKHFQPADTFVDVFAGGGSVYTNVLDRYENIVVNDIIRDLILLHENLITDKDRIVSKLLTDFYIDKNDQDVYNLIRNNYNSNLYAENNFIAFYALLLSCTNNMMRFNNSFKFNQTFGRRFYNSSTETKLNTWIEHVKSYDKNIIYESRHFSKLDYNQDSFYYFDPPYGFIRDGDFIGTKQISEAGYNCYWKKEDDLKLYEIISTKNIKFAISGLLEHDCRTSWLLDKLKNDGYKLIELEFDYNKVARNKNDKNSIEVLITNK